MSNEQCPASQSLTGQDQLTPDIETPNMRSLRRRSSNRFAYRTKAHCFVRSPRKATYPRLQTIKDGTLLDTGLLNEARQYFESQLLDLKEQLKNDCKIRLTEKVAAVESDQSSLFDRLANLERENHKLKSIVGDLRKSIDLLQARSLINKSTATVRAAANPPTNKTAASTTDPPPPSASPLPAHQLDADFPPLSAVASRPPPPSLISPTRPAVCGVPIATTHSTPSSPRVSPSRALFKPSRDNSPTTSPAPPPASSAPVYTIPVHNKFAALSDSPQRSVGTSVQIPVHVSDRTGPHRSPRLSVSLAEMAVVGSTDYLIIGDSVLTHMRADKMNPGDYVSPQKISKSGLTAFQVTQWLQTLTPNPKVSRLVIHVGVNDCKGGEISTDQWSSLLSLCRSRFPSATVIASSIIPARGRHPINPAIAKSNDNLKSVCRQRHVIYVDHHDTFVARSQAPKKALYDNALHPSRQGLMKLARNIKYPNANVSQSQGKEGRNPRPCPPPPTLQTSLPSHLCHPGPSQPHAASPPVQSANRLSPTAQQQASLDHGAPWQPWPVHRVSPPFSGGAPTPPFTGGGAPPTGGAPHTLQAHDHVAPSLPASSPAPMMAQAVQGPPVLPVTSYQHAIAQALRLLQGVCLYN